MAVGGSASSASISQAGKEIIAGKPTILCKDDINRIRQESVIVTDKEKAQQAKAKEAKHLASRVQAQERKNRMIEKEVQVRSRREQYAAQMELDIERTSVLTKEAIQEHAHLDSVKYIQSLVAVASAAAGCDEILIEKEVARQKEVAYNQYMDKMMDADRIKELKERDVKAKIEREKRVAARKMLEGSNASSYTYMHIYIYVLVGSVNIRANCGAPKTAASRGRSKSDRGKEDFASI
jgi:hypothetical protein